jgi:hypothetical protein
MGLLSKIGGFTFLTIRNVIFWDVTPRGSLFLCSVLRFLVTANVPSSPILVTLIMEAIRSSETSVLTRAIQRSIPECGILNGVSEAIIQVITKISTFWDKIHYNR